MGRIIYTSLADITVKNDHIKKYTFRSGSENGKSFAAMAARQTTMADEGTDVGDEVQCILFVCKE